MHIIIGALVIVGGALISIKSEWFLASFGSINFMDRNFGAEGGSRLGYKLLGIIIAFIGMLIFTNMIGGFLQWLLGPLLKYSDPNL